MLRLKCLAPALALMILSTAHARNDISTAGTLVVVPAHGEVTLANDEARATFMVEEQDRDKALAASRVNQKMKQGMDILKREDPQAVLRSRDYFTYPVYADEQSNSHGKAPQIVGWRVGQYLDLVTRNIEHLPKTVAAAQKTLALNGLQFDLSPDAMKKMDSLRIESAYQNLTERMHAVAKAMGRNVADAAIESIDFEGADSNPPPRPMRMAAAAMEAKSAPPVEEPSFEPGETILQMHVVGKVRFK